MYVTIVEGAINLSEKNKYYSIGKVSSICDVPIKTLRYYDQIGLLVPQYRKEDSHYRYYEHTQLLTLHIIRKLRLLGVSLKDIQRIIQNCDNAAMEQCVVSRMHEISKHIQELQDQLAIGEVLFQRLNTGNVFLQNKNQDSESTIRIEKIPLYHVISTRRIKLDYQNSDVSIDRWSELIELAKKYHLKTMGSIILTYHNEPLEQFYNKDCDLESCIQVPEPKDGPEFKQFGGFLAATTIHIGKNEDIIQTHVKAIKWIKQQGYVINGPISEEYIVSPIDVSEVENHITKVIIPIKRV